MTNQACLTVFSENCPHTFTLGLDEHCHQVSLTNITFSDAEIQCNSHGNDYHLYHAKSRTTIVKMAIKDLPKLLAK